MGENTEVSNRKDITMSDTKKITTQFSDPDKSHAELDTHRAQAERHFSGHVHVVNTNTTSIPKFNDEGGPDGFIIVMTSVWRKAPSESTETQD